MKIIDIFPPKIQYYKSIDELPIRNWFKIQDTDDITWMLKKKYSVNAKQLAVLAKAFADCQAQYIDTFGLSDNYRKILTLKWEIAVLRSELVMQGKRTNQVYIDLKTLDLKVILTESKASETGSVKVMIEKHMGFKLNENEVTVKEFYEYLNDLKRTVEQQIAANERG